jgi:hypothetical protein
MVFWRFMLPEGPIDTPTAEVVPLDAVRDTVAQTQGTVAQAPGSATTPNASM